MSGKCTKEKISRGNVRSPVYWCGQQTSSTIDLVYYTQDGRARRGWMRKVYYTLVTVTKKNYGLDKQKSVAVATSFKRSQPNFTAFISTCRAIPIMKIGEDRSRIFWNNSARTSSQNRKQFRQLRSSKATKNGVIRQFKYDFLFDIQSNYMSISCHFGDISWRKSVDLVNKNWLSWLSPLRDQKIAIDRHLQPKFYQMCKFRED